MRRILVLGVIVAVAVAGVVIASRRPAPVTPLVTGVTDDPAVAAILARSCQDCHSDRTRRPWYGHIPPASWLLDSDIGTARSHMDFSRWNQYAPDDKKEILGSIAANVRNHKMPPGRYLFMHPDARLSDNDAARVYVWTRSERRRMKTEAAKAGGNAQ